MTETLEQLYFKQLELAWAVYEELSDRNSQLVREIRRLNDALKGNTNE